MGGKGVLVGCSPASSGRNGVDRPEKGLTWRRIASGLFQPLGLKAVGGSINVCCRDQIVRLRDLNGDGETDFYENFNNDHQVTEHFHEFAMDLQTDAEGNFYYAKAARHGLPALVPHHGTLLKVRKDGSRTEILATYTCGLFGWAGDQTEPGGFYRVRATGKPMFLPIGLSARKDGMVLRFTAALDPQATIDVSRYSARIWSIKRTSDYGSDHYGERSLKITAASLSADGHTVFLKIPGIRPARCMEITYRIRGRGGETVDGVIHSTIHKLGDAEANAENPSSIPGSATR